MTAREAVAGAAQHALDLDGLNGGGRMSTTVILSFAVPMLLTLVAPGLRLLIPISVALAGVIGWQDYAFWQAANSDDFTGPPHLPLGAGAVNLSAAGLAIGVLTRTVAHAFHTAKRPLTWPWLLLLFIGVSGAVSAAYFGGVFRL